MHSLDSAHDCKLAQNQSTVYFGDSPRLDANLALVPADYETLLAELAQAQKRDQDRCTRIRHLEQALDQALACLEDMRSQVQDQQFLEIQLANTEEYASVQQQAITRLKFQIAEQQQALEAQILETQQRDQAVQELLATIENMTQAQQREVERLRSRLAQDQIEVQTHRSRLGKHLQDLQTTLESRQHRVVELEAESLAARTLSMRLQSQLETAHQQIKELSTRLSHNRLHLVQLETQLEQQAGLRTTQAGASCSSTASSASLKPAHPSLIEDLERQLAQQLAQQARWQQQQHELETERDQLQTRVIALEQQVAEMQEQILQQAQQQTEYETAVQYWKDRHTLTQEQISHLRELAEQLLLSPTLELHPLLIELLNILEVSLPSEKLAGKPTDQPTGSKPIPPLPLPRLTTVELPEFLMRRRAAQQATTIEPLPDSPISKSPIGQKD